MDENASDPIMPNVSLLSPLSEVNSFVGENNANYAPELDELVENEIESHPYLYNNDPLADSNLDQPIYANREIAPVGTRSKLAPPCEICRTNLGKMENCYAQKGFTRSICETCRRNFEYFIFKSKQLGRDANGSVIVPDCVGEDCWSPDELDKLDKTIAGKGGKGSANEFGNKEPCSSAQQAMAQLPPPLKRRANEVGEMVVQQNNGGFTADDLIERMDELDLEVRKGQPCKFPSYAIYDWQKCDCNCRMSKPSPPIDNVLRMPWMEDRTHHFSNFLTKHGLHPPREAVVARGAVICKKYRFIMATDLLTWFVENNTLFEEVPSERLKEYPDRNYFIFCMHRKSQHEMEIFYGTDDKCLAGYGPFIMFQFSRRYFYCKRFEQLRQGNPVLDAQLQYETVRQQFTNSCVCGEEKDWGTLNGVHCLMNWAIVSGKQFGPLRRQIHALTPQQMQMPLEDNKPLYRCEMGRLLNAPQFRKYFLQGHESAPQFSLSLTEHDQPPSPPFNCFIYCESEAGSRGVFYGTDEHCEAGASNWEEFKKLRKYYY